MNTYKKQWGVGVLWLTRHSMKNVCPERASRPRDLSSHTNRIHILSERSEPKVHASHPGKNVCSPPLQSFTAASTLSVHYFDSKKRMPNLSPDLIVLGFLSYVVFLFSTTCHEASHAFAAKIGGDQTAAMGGQVSLNPIPHIRRSPWGMVIIPIAAFLFWQSMIGWASAPYDPNWERRHPHRSAWMALAGPAANFSLMLLAALGLRLGQSYGFLYEPGTGHVGLLGNILYIFFSLNLLLGVFNLLPAPPLDGSTAIMLFMSEERAHRYLDWIRGGSYALAGLLVAMVVFKYIYGPIQAFVTYQLLFNHF
jgi:Zn-dependent protease